MGLVSSTRNDDNSSYRKLGERIKIDRLDSTDEIMLRLDGELWRRLIDDDEAIENIERILEKSKDLFQMCGLSTDRRRRGGDADIFTPRFWEVLNRISSERNNDLASPKEIDQVISRNNQEKSLDLPPADSYHFLKREPNYLNSYNGKSDIYNNHPNQENRRVFNRPDSSSEDRDLRAKDPLIGAIQPKIRKLNLTTEQSPPGSSNLPTRLPDTPGMSSNVKTGNGVKSSWKSKTLGPNTVPFDSFNGANTQEVRAKNRMRQTVEIENELFSNNDNSRLTLKKKETLLGYRLEADANNKTEASDEDDDEFHFEFV